MITPDLLIRRLAALPAGDRTIAVRAALLLPCVQVLLRIPGPGWTLAQLTRRRAARTPRLLPTPSRVGWLVEATARRLPWPTTCLERAVVSAWLLTSRGIACELLIGADPCMHPFGAHAWVEADGRAVGPAPDPACEVVARWLMPVPVEP